MVWMFMPRKMNKKKKEKSEIAPVIVWLAKNCVQLYLLVVVVAVAVAILISNNIESK